MLQIRCPNSKCGKSYHVDEERLGSAAKCRACGLRFKLSAEYAVASETDDGTLIKNADETQDYQSSPSRSRADIAQRSDFMAGPSDLPAQLGRFQIRALLGAGAFGTVYRAYDPVLDRDVALKVPQSSALQDEQAVTRFLREAKAAAQLRHPNIVPIYDTGKDGKQLYIASAFIEGQTLDAALKSGGIDFRQASLIVRELADALAYAHAQGIVHRDIKPANIMLDVRGKPHLMDFGLARLANEQEKLTHDGSIVGTPAYMSPEQAGGETTASVGPQSDQYSLGVVLYELLCGKRPFEGPVEVVIFNVLKVDPATASSIVPTIPKDLDTICQKAMAKDPEKRYADCESLAEDLRRWQNDEPIQARRLGYGERLIRWGRRNPAVAGLSAVAAALLVLVAVISAVGYLSTKAALRQVEEHQLIAAKNLVEAERQRELAQSREAEANRQAEIAKANQLEAEFQRELVIQNREEADRQKLAAEERQKEVDRERELAKERELENERQRTLAQEAQASAALAKAESERLFALASEGDATSPSKIYNSEMKRVQGLWEESIYSEWKQIVNAQERWEGDNSDPRGFEWYYWRNYLNSVGEQEGLERGAAPYTIDQSFRVTPETREFEIVENIRASALKLTSVHSYGLAFSSDGERVMSLDYDGLATVWIKGRVLRDGTCDYRLLSSKSAAMRAREQLEPRSKGVVGAFSRDGFHLASCVQDRRAAVYNLGAGQVERELGGHTKLITCMAFSPSGKRIVTGSEDDTVRLWDMPSGKRSQTLENDEYTRKVTSIAFSANGSYVAMAGVLQDIKDHPKQITLSLWNVATRTFSKLSKFNEHPAAIRAMSFDSSGTRLVTGCDDNIVRIWDLTGKSDFTALARHSKPISSVAFSPDGKRVVSGSYDGTVVVWDVESAEPLLTLCIDSEQTDWAQFVAFHPNGQSLATSGRNGIVIWKGPRVLPVVEVKEKR